MARAKSLETLESLSPCSVEVDDFMVIDDRFEILGDIGGGAYGTVYKARDRKNDSVVALKKVAVIEDTIGVGLPPLLLREVTNLKRLESPYIVNLLDVHESGGRYEREAVWYMVFEHMEEDLDHFIKHSLPSGMPKCIVKDFLRQILRGADVMHMNHIVHRDLKPQNVLVSRDGRRVKVADFGLSRQIGSNVVVSTQVVTQWYRAPEVLLHSSYSESVDMWSIGCIFAEMLTGRPLFSTEKRGEKQQLQQIFRVIGTPTAASWPSKSQIALSQFVIHQPQPWINICKETYAQDILSKLLQFDAAKRILAQDALRHEYFGENYSEGYHSPESALSPSLNNSIDSGIIDI